MCVDQATLVSLECGRVHALFTPVCWKPPNSRAILHQLMPQVSLPLSEGARTPGEAPSRKGPPPLGSLSEFTRHTSSLSHHIVHWRSSLPPIDLRQSHLQRPPAFPLGCMTSILSLQHGHQLYVRVLMRRCTRLGLCIWLRLVPQMRPSHGSLEKRPLQPCSVRYEHPIGTLINAAQVPRSKHNRPFVHAS